MKRKSGRADRRTEALSQGRIVAAAIELLDSEGEDGLTFRALAARLATGAGAIYWHVADKDELLAATTDEVVAAVMSIIGDEAAPADAIRAVALGLFDAIDAHPWVGAQLARAPWQSAMLQIFERVGVQLQALRVPKRAQLFAASALVNYVLGCAGQNAAAARNPAHGGDRDAFLATIAARWSKLDAATFPFIRQMAKQLPGHDDREQFLAGIDLILAGIAAG
ncbi:MAG TPA: helix-turn-helix domain-containing protein [Polyangia bacterium]|nr:helix-turn-helix domain-containing protein [Polyangia bacterium]